MTDWTLMKSTPCALSESTAATALARVVMAIELGKRSLLFGRYPSSMGPEMIHAWADGLAVRDLFAPLQENRNVSAHIAHADDTVGDEKRQDDVAPTGKPIAKGGVHMHVPKPRNEILTGGIDHPRDLRRLEFGRVRNRGDVIASDYNGPICLNR